MGIVVVVLLAHRIFHAEDGVLPPGALSDVASIGAPLLVLVIGLLFLEARTRPRLPTGER